MVKEVATGIFSETSICLLGRRSENPCEYQGVCQTYKHCCQVIRPVVIWSCPRGFKGLFTIGIDLVLVNAVEVFAKRVQGSGVVADQDLEGANLVEVERTVVAGGKGGR